MIDNKIDEDKKGGWHTKFVKEKPTFREFIENCVTLPDEFIAYTKHFNYKDFYFVLR